MEDLGSTNGTAIDGESVDRGPVAIGSELCIGPVRLRVEALDPDQDALALVFDDEPASERSLLSVSACHLDRSTVMVGQESAEQAARWLDCIDGLLAQLLAGVRDLGRVLAFLGQSLHVNSCSLVQWTERGDVVALAAWGDLREVPSHDDAQRILGRCGSDRSHLRGVAFFQLPIPLSVAVSRRPGGDLVGLVLGGDFPNRLASANFLQIAFRLLDQFHPALSTNGAPNPGADEPSQYDDLIFPSEYRPGCSSAMVSLYSQMQALARGNLPVLICGETGVGKEMVARILHNSSDRRHGPFIAINCAAIPADLLEAEMFGVEKGVATGVEAREGKFQQAESGSLFLDEITEMAPVLQAKLLRALQEKEIVPLGSRPRPIDVRVISASNVDLARQMEAGTLRRDLYYRLAGCVLQVPALRQCREDIPGLVEHFLRAFARESGKRIRGVTVAAMRILAGYYWPGNIRELEHQMHRLISVCPTGGVIGAEHLSAMSSQPQAQPETSAAWIAAMESVELAPALRRVEEQLIREALRRTGGIKLQACKLLGLSRNGLDNKLKRLGIDAAALDDPAISENAPA